VALTTIPAAGAKLRASVLSALLTERTPIVAVVASDQALTASSTVLQNVTDLTVPVAASATYDGTLVLAAYVAAGTTEDIKIAFTFPTGAALDFFGAGPETAATTTTAQGNWVATIGGPVDTARSYGLISSSSSPPKSHWTTRCVCQPIFTWWRVCRCLPTVRQFSSPASAAFVISASSGPVQTSISRPDHSIGRSRTHPRSGVGASHTSAATAGLP